MIRRLGEACLAGMFLPLGNRAMLVLGAVVAYAAAADAAPQEIVQRIAFAVDVPAETPQAERDLVDRLAGLLREAIESDKRFTICEWPSVPRVLGRHPQVPGAERIQAINAAVGIGLRVTLEVVPPASAGEPSWARLRIVETRGKLLRGMTVVRLDEDLIEETTRQFWQYLAMHSGFVHRPALTVAVAPLENVGRSDRLAPLEVGIADLIASQLLATSGATLDGGLLIEDVAHSCREPIPRGSFQVLRRPSLARLQDELDLIQAGLPDKNSAPNEIPSAGTTYFIRGQFEEAMVGGSQAVAVRGALIHVATGEAVREFRFTCVLANLDERLATQIDRLVDALPANARGPRLAPPGTRFEVEALRNLVMADLPRLDDIQTFHRGPPICITREHAPPARNTEPINGLVSDQVAIHGLRNMVLYDSPAGRHLLRSAIDRLNTILLVTPDDAIATFALAYCYSLPGEGTYRPELAEELLRQIIADPDKVFAALRSGFPWHDRKGIRQAALVSLMRIGFDPATREFVAADQAATLRRIGFAFKESSDESQFQEWHQLGQFIQSYFDTMHRTKRPPIDSPELQRAIADVLPRLDQLASQYTGKPAGAGDANLAVGQLARLLAEQATDAPELRAVAIDLFKRWAEEENYQRSGLGLRNLTELCASSEDYLAAAALWERATARINDDSPPYVRAGRGRGVVYQAKCYRLAQQPQRGLDLLLALDPGEGPAAREIIYYRLEELAACYDALAKQGEALSTYIAAAEKSLNPAPSWKMVDRIKALGGIPVRADRAVDVEYFPFPADVKFGYVGPFIVIPITLAATGNQLFLGDVAGLYAFDLTGHVWQPLNPALGAVTCLACAEGMLWAGTDERGLWQCELKSGNWTQLVPPESLPLPHVESIALGADKIYLGIGRFDGRQPGSPEPTGRVVEISRAGEVYVFDGAEAPTTRVTHIVVRPESLLVRSDRGVHEWSRAGARWRKATPKAAELPAYTLGIYAGRDGVWASNQHRELFRWDHTTEEDAILEKTWTTPDPLHQRGGYGIRFVAEHGDHVWFGGWPRTCFVSSSLYRLNLATGVLDEFGPADSFRLCPQHRIDDGLWIGDRLWLATSQGLCVVSERE